MGSWTLPWGTCIHAKKKKIALQRTKQVLKSPKGRQMIQQSKIVWHILMWKNLQNILSLGTKNIGRCFTTGIHWEQFFSKSMKNIVLSMEPNGEEEMLGRQVGLGRVSAIVGSGTEGCYWGSSRGTFIKRIKDRSMEGRSERGLNTELRRLAELHGVLILLLCFIREITITHTILILGVDSTGDVRSV